MKLNRYVQQYNLNSDQQQLFREIEKFFSSIENPVFLLKGYAGVGKTYVTSVLTNFLTEAQRSFVLMAPTGKAARVLSEKSKLPVTTIHSGIYNCVDKNAVEYIDGSPSITNQTKGFLKNNTFPDDTVFIIDEASMVSNRDSSEEDLHFGSGRVLADLIKFIDIENFPNRKIIFIGDAAQLPPVKMSTSPALSSDYLSEHFELKTMEYELTTVVRQSGDNGVMKLLTGIRQGEIEPYIFNPSRPHFAPRVSNIPFLGLKDRYLELCDFGLHGVKHVAVIADRNWRVKAFNMQLREVFFPNSERLEVGEQIVAAKAHNQHGFRIANGEFGEVTEILSPMEVRSVCLDMDYDGFCSELIDLFFIDVCVRFNDLEGIEQHFRTKLILNALDGSAPGLHKEERDALSEDFRERHQHINPATKEYKELFKRDPYVNAMVINYGYAFTCHKAQGGEWPIVIVDSLVNIKSEKQRRSWLYTALSRTSDQLLLINHNENGHFYDL